MGLCSFGEGELGSHLTQCRLGDLHVKWHLDPSNHLSTADMGRKLGLRPLLGEVELGFHLTLGGQDRGLPAYQFHLDPSNRLATVNKRHRQTGQDRTMVR